MHKNSNIKAVFAAKLKLSFLQPLFYVTAILFCVITAVNFYIRRQFFTGSGSSDLLLFFSFVPYLCIIFIPALCYKTSDSVYDAYIPLSSSKKILINFLVLLIQYITVLVFLLPSVLMVNIFGSIDFGQVTACFICLIFYGAAIISICIFINELITNPMISFVVSAIILALINSSHLAIAYIDTGKVLTAFFKLLSFAWHFNSAANGIIDSRDITYLAFSTALFLWLTDFVHQKKCGKKYTKKMIFRPVLEVLLLVLLLLNGQRWYISKDISANKTYSLSSYTKQLLKLAQSEVKITYYRSSSLARLYPQIRTISDFLNNYASQNNNISSLTKDPDADSSLSALLENYGIVSQQLRTVKNNSTEYINVYSAITLEYEGRAEVIPFTLGAESLEYDLDGRLLHLISGKERQVTVVVGNGMSLTEDYSFGIPFLSSQGFSCNPLFIEDPNFALELSSVSGLLVVIGDSEINIENAIAIENYVLSDKGPCLFMLNPYTAAIEEDWALSISKGTNLVEMVENWGVTFEQAIAADVSCAKITMYSQEESDNPFKANSTYTKILNYPQWIQGLPQENASKGFTVFWATPLKLSSENTIPYLVSSPSAYKFEVDRNSPQKIIESNPFEIENYALPKEKDSLILGAKITGELNGLYNLGKSRNANITVIPDQYFLNTLMTGYIGGEYGDYRNFDFLISELLKLNGENEMALLQQKQQRDISLYKINDEVELAKKQLITYFILFFIVPVFIILCGGALWLYQKKHRTKFYSAL